MSQEREVYEIIPDEGYQVRLKSDPQTLIATATSCEDAIEIANLPEMKARLALAEKVVEAVKNERSLIHTLGYSDTVYGEAIDMTDAALKAYDAGIKRAE